VRLAALGAELSGARIVGDGDVEIVDLAYDSRKVGAGTLFFCVPGGKVDGHEFARGAVEAGAVALVVERELDLAVAQVVVPDARAAMAPAAARFFGDPSGELRVVGVTGTNGKTTTAFLVREILEAAGIQTGLLGTVRQVVGGVEEEVERTTPEAIDLQATFRRMLDAGDRACAMEVSSHALALHRCDAIGFEVALFTNLTQDHLDFHGTMEEYFAAKRLLFEMEPGSAVVNLDDPYGRRLAEEFECATFSTQGAEADFRARDVSFDASGSQFTVGDETRVRTGLPGGFNVANALGAFAAAVAMGVAPEAAAEGLARAERVPGRLEPIDEGQGFAVLVDYAHTPDSLANVLAAARALTGERLIVVFGAGGDRDRDKRPKMGRAAEAADLLYVTSDNPRSEAPESIVAEVRSGIEREAGVTVIVDRREAIARALGEARPGDVVVIAGKGHEQGQEFEGGRKIPFDDREVAREELRKAGRRVRMTAGEIAAAMQAEIVVEGGDGAPLRATIDSAETGPGDLFFGLRGERVDGGEFAPAAIEAGAWGAVVGKSLTSPLVPDTGTKGEVSAEGGWVFVVSDPLVALQALARYWRRTLGARTVGITGSVGKTSVKDIARALLPGPVHANRENLNTEIGLPLTILEAPDDTKTLVLEMAMRGPGQIAELAAIAEPELAVITNVGPVHVELLGSLEAIAAAKAEVLAALPDDGVAIVPAAAGALEPHLGDAPSLLRFGAGGDVSVVESRVRDGVTEALIETPAGRQRFHFPFAEAHNLENALAAVAVGVALGAPLAEMADRVANIGFSRFRGERLELGGGIVLVNDCYNANPVSMRAALDHLASIEGERRIAVLGEMAELGPGAADYHREIGDRAREAGVELLIGVGEPAREYGPDELVGTPEEAAELLAAQVEPGDTILVKGSRSAGLETVAETLEELVDG